MCILLKTRFTPVINMDMCVFLYCWNKLKRIYIKSNIFCAQRPGDTGVDVAEESLDMQIKLQLHICKVVILFMHFW